MIAIFEEHNSKFLSLSPVVCIKDANFLQTLANLPSVLEYNLKKCDANPEIGNVCLQRKSCAISSKSSSLPVSSLSSTTS